MRGCFRADDNLTRRPRTPDPCVVGQTNMTDVPELGQARMRRLDNRSSEELARLCAECTDFFELIHGRPGGPTTAAEILGPLPSHVARGEKHVFGVYVDSQIEGVAEVLEGYPSRTEWYVGLLMLRPQARAHGLGASVWHAIRAWIRSRNGVAVRVIVQTQNPRARHFWERHGFEFESEVPDRSAGAERSSWKLRLSMPAAAQPGVATDGASPRR